MEQKKYNVDGCDIQDVQRHILGVLMVIDRLCTENGIRYTLSEGTLLGAIRHQGFIPWDDDGDVMMPRDDYEKFVKIAAEQMPEGYCFQCLENTKNYPYNFGKVFDTGTVYTESGTSHLSLGHAVYVDIFPMDYATEDTYRYHAKMVSHYTDIRYQKLKMIHEARLAPFALAPLSFLNWRATRHMKYHYKKRGDNLIEMCFLGPNRPMVHKSLFEDVVRVPFNGEMLPVPADYDFYLTARYGDYMTPPPDKLQGPTHNISKVRL